LSRTISGEQTRKIIPNLTVIVLCQKASFQVSLCYFRHLAALTMAAMKFLQKLIGDSSKSVWAK
jgi:hypothetical protein